MSEVSRCTYELLKEQAVRHSAASALLASGRNPLTYQALLSQAESTVATLNSMGIGREDRVAIVLSNGPEMAASFLGVASGAIAAPLNPSYRASEFDFYLSDLSPKAVIVESGSDSAVVSVAESRGIPLIELRPCPEHGAGRFALYSDKAGSPVDPAFALPNDVALVLHTSGTTSRPKIVPLTHENLCQSADNIKVLLELTAADRCLNVMPLFHIHGLIGAILSSIAAGGSVVCTPGFFAPKFFAWMDEFRPTWYTAVPTMHQAILARAKTNEAVIADCALRLIRSSSSALPPSVLRELEEVFAAPVIESYGMTEASHQMASNPLPPRERKPGSVGVAAGPEIAIMDEEGDLLNAGQTGEVVIRGRNVTRGYQNNPEANESAFRNGWFRTGDQGSLDSDGYLFLTGRLKEIINRGGEKISPREVDEVLLDHPAVAQAVAFALPDARLGEDVAAAAVLREKTSATELELRQFVANRLADFKVPRRIVFVDQIPKGPTGKLQRIGLASKLGLADATPDAAQEAALFVPPSTETEVQLAEIWAEVLGVERVGAHDNFFDLGGDSILATQLIARVRQVSDAALSILGIFESPTLAEMARLLDRESRSQAEANLPLLRAVPRDQALPLSLGQQRIWFLSQFNEANLGLRPAVFRLRGSLNVEVLEKSISAIIRRHEPLRTTVQIREDEPAQRITKKAKLSVPIVDLRELTESERDGRARQLWAEELRRPFDLSTDLMLRATLIRLGAEEHWLMLTMHHIASDGWSTAVFLRELAVLYEAHISGKRPLLPELPIQYADYAHWQRELLEGGFFERHLSYWTEHLQGIPAVLPLRTDRPRPADPNDHGARESLVLPAELSEALKSLSQREGATLFMTLLGAFQTLLYRYTEVEDIVVGCPVAGRTQLETEALIGPFFNMLVLRTDLSNEPTFRELLKRVRGVALGAYAHQDLPFESLVHALRPQRVSSHTPLFQVLFQLRNMPPETTTLPGLRIEELDLDPRHSVLDLSLDVTEKPEGLLCRMHYKVDLFEAETIRGMLVSYQALLEALVRDPDASISRLPILGDGERRRLLAEWNDTRKDYPRTSFHELFEAQVKRTPEAAAVVFGDQQRSYQDLNARANRLSHHLRSLGVGPDVIVGLCMERSADLPVGLLGILKAGGAYLPLDPKHPADRSAFMLQDAQAPLVLTQQNLLHKLPAMGVRVVSLDGHWPEISRNSKENPPRVSTSENLAYVTYTSGSTGRPKGVAVEHRSLVSYLCWVNEVLANGQEWHSLPVLASLSFDASLKQLFAPLLRGDSVHVFPPGVEAQPDLLAETLAKTRTVALNCVPSLWSAVLSEIETGRHKTLEESLAHLYLGGEDFPPELLERSWACLPRLQIWNLYGPTETTATASAAKLVSPRTVTIGRPIANTQIYLLDRCLNPVSAGMAGELHIGGAQVARGYLNRPDLTAQKFIPDPFSKDPAARLYKTGDLGRHLPDGNIQFLGRLDHQVKVRGFRVELGEIEAALSLHPAIKQCVALLRQDEPGGKRLVVYAAPKPGQSVNGVEIRGYLRRKLPDYMVPSRVVILGSLPLTSGGKVDRAALPAPGHSRPADGAYVEPRTPVERTIADLWSRLLSLDHVGINDNFFELGGDSLLAARVVSGLRLNLQAELRLHEFFETPTIAGLALAVTKDRVAKSDEQAIERLLNSVESLPRSEVDRLLADAAFLQGVRSESPER